MDCKIYWMVDLIIYYKAVWKVELVDLKVGLLVYYQIMKGNMTWSFIMRFNCMCYKYIVHFHLLRPN